MKNKFLNYTFFCFIFLNNIITESKSTSSTNNINGENLQKPTVTEILNGENAQKPTVKEILNGENAQKSTVTEILNGENAQKSTVKEILNGENAQKKKTESNSQEIKKPGYLERFLNKSTENLKALNDKKTSLNSIFTEIKAADGKATSTFNYDNFTELLKNEKIKSNMQKLYPSFFKDGNLLSKEELTKVEKYEESISTFIEKNIKNIDGKISRNASNILANNPNLLKYTKRTSLIFAGLGIAAYGANEGYKSYNNKGFIFDTLNKIKNKEIFDLTDKNDNNKKDDHQQNNNNQQSDVKDKNISNKGDQQKNNNESANKSITAGTIAAITTATAAISLAIIYIYKKITDYKNSKKTKANVNQNTKTVKYKAVA